MQKLLRSLIFVTVLVGLICLVFPVMAQVDSIDCTGLGLGLKCSKTDNKDSLLGYAHNIINFGLSLVGLVAVVFIIIGGVRYIISRGEEEEAEKGKKTVIYAIIGLILIGLAYAIVKFVGTAIQQS
jgi:hypothetical protein